ncbi:MAG TPA: carbohydrate kinase [Beutenbergiaceae bacterium]|nr:carbohydrate kinase [Beutenbergiaceae bacterium]
MSSCLVIGETIIDGIRDPQGDLVEYPGGSAANVAIGLARLGRSVDLATWFGPDPHGAVVRTNFKVNDVRVVPGSDRAERTSTAVATIDHAGSATYEFDMDWRVPEVHLDSSVRVVHTGSIAITLQPGADGVVEILRVASEFSTIFYDPNLRPTIMGEVSTVAPRVEDLVSVADVVKVSDEDLLWLYTDVEASEVARRWATQGPAVVIVTKGDAGAFATSATGVEVEVPAPAVQVVDTVGAGDSFTAGLIDRMWTSDLVGADRRTYLQAIDQATLTEIVQWAIHCAAVTVSRAGADPAHRNEVEDLAQEASTDD